MGTKIDFLLLVSPCHPLKLLSDSGVPSRDWWSAVIFTKTTVMKVSCQISLQLTVGEHTNRVNHNNFLWSCHNISTNQIWLPKSIGQCAIKAKDWSLKSLSVITWYVWCCSCNVVTVHQRVGNGTFVVTPLSCKKCFLSPSNQVTIVTY